MKNTLCAAIVGITGLLITPTIASAQRISQSIPQRIPWDVIISDGAKRFVVLQDFNSEAVLDQETSLVWEKQPSLDDTTWQQAHEHCINLFKGARGGWRLPTIQELTSLKTTPSAPPGYPASDPLPAGHPFGPDGFGDGYRPDVWSATSFETTEPTGFAWVFGLWDGKSFIEAKNGVRDHNPAWCVRFRQGVDPQ